MLRIRLFGNHANFTGHLGMTEFKDGVSVNELNMHEKIRFPAIWDCQIFDDEGASASPSPQIPESDPVEDPEANQSTQSQPGERLYALEYLSKLADEQGIGGLRELADKHGIKGVSIQALIDKLVEVTTVTDGAEAV